MYRKKSIVILVQICSIFNYKNGIFKTHHSHQVTHISSFTSFKLTLLCITIIMESSDNNDIVGCKKQPRYTSPGLRVKLALIANEVTHLRALCKMIDDEEEFQYHLLVLLFTSLSSSYVLKQMNNECSDDNDSISKQ
jgi:hypothetical protein